MNPAQCLRSLLLGGLISASLIGAAPASGQYFGPAFFGFRPGMSVGVGPGVAIGAIPRWSRRAPIYSPRYAPLYPPIGYRGSVAVAPVLPIAPLPPVRPYGHGISGSPESHVSFGPGHVDIQVPGFSYQARRSAGPSPVGFPTPPAVSRYGNPQAGGSAGHPALRLADSLAQREDGDVWLNYLQPERLAMTDNPNEASELALRLQGVMANPDLAWLQELDGFTETVAWLSEGQMSPSMSSPDDNSVAPQPQEQKLGEPKFGEPTLAPSLPEGAPENSEESSNLETLPAPKPEPTTSL